MKSTSYKIRIRATVNGVEKAPSHIAWVNGSDECLVRKCYKEKDYIVIELIPDCVGDSCIEGWVHFDDACTDCDPIHFKRCFCSQDSDCGDCEECVLGVCQSICPVDVVCKNGKCTECDDIIKCPDGQICKDGKCVCPPGTFYSNQYKRCVECDSTTVFTDKCKSCVNGHILHVDCYGVCDPATGECIDCIKSSDCNLYTDGRNCCDNKVCKCCAGTVWNPTLGKCVEDCKDTGCPTCQRCGPEGCEPIKCPTGFKCVEGECIEWPCKDTTCNNGADCGKDCGCLDGQCVPCKILNCATGQCASVLGCECASNNVCKGSDDCDATYCDGFSPCLTDGCTCYEYSCVDCNNFSCANGECSNQPGCQCLNGKCTGTPPGPGGDGCSDSFTLSADCGAECKLKATLNSGPCKCDPVKFEVKPTVVPGNAFFPGGYTSVSVEMYKGTTKYADYKTAETIGNNELVTGEVKVFVTYTKPGAKTEQITLTAKIVNNIVETVLIPDKPGYTMTFSVQNKGIKISNNSCTDYDDEQIATYNSADILAGVTKENMSKDSTSDRKPLFTWYKNGTLIKKDFPKGSAGSYEDFIDDPKLATLGDDFVVKAECGCATTTSLSNLEFCCSTVDVPITACGTTASIPKIELCDLVKKQAKAKIAFKQSDGITVEKELSDAKFDFTSAKDTNIESAEFYLEVNGKKQCVKPLPIPLKTAPTPIFTPTCGDASDTSTEMKITAPASYSISSITFTPPGIIENITNQSIPGKGFTVDKNRLATAGGVEANVTYSNGCIAKVRIEPCPFDALVTSTPSRPDCENLGLVGTIYVAPISFDNKKPVKYSVFKNNELVNTFTESANNAAGKKIIYNGDGTYTIEIEELNTNKKLIKSVVVTAPDDIAFPQITTYGGSCLDDLVELEVLLGSSFKNVPVIITYEDEAGDQSEITKSSDQYGAAKFLVKNGGKYKVTLVKDSSVTICNSEQIVLTKQGTKYKPTASVQAGCVGKDLVLTIPDNLYNLSISAIGGSIDFNNKTFYANPDAPMHGVTFTLNNICDSFVADSSYTIENNSATIKFNNISKPIVYTNLEIPCNAGKASATLNAPVNATVKLLAKDGTSRTFMNSNGAFSLYNISVGQYTIEISEEGKCTATNNIAVGTCAPVVGAPFNIYTEALCVQGSSTVLMPAYIDLETLPSPSGFITWAESNCSNGSMLTFQGPFPYNVATGSTTNLQRSYSTSAYSPTCVKAIITYGDNVESISNMITLEPEISGYVAKGESCNSSGSPCQCADYLPCQETLDHGWTCGGVDPIPVCSDGEIGQPCNPDEGCNCVAGQCVQGFCRWDCQCGYAQGFACICPGPSGQCGPNGSCGQGGPGNEGGCSCSPN